MEKTKAEGYEALRKIEEILEGFDPEDSYVGKAFEGCVEQAKENLRYDGKMSWKAEYEIKNREVTRLTEKLAEVNKMLRESEVARVDLVKELNQKDDAIARLEDANRQFSKEIDQSDAERLDLSGKVWEAEALIKDLRQTIIELKAKLYDMMTREEVKA